MNLHELALLLDKLREAFEFGLTASIKRDLSDLTAAFRELPDQSVRDFLKSIRDKPKAAPARRGKAPPVNLDELVGRIQQVRTHPDPATLEQLQADIGLLNNSDLKKILRRLQCKTTRETEGNRQLLLQFLRGETISPYPSTFNGAELQQIDDAVKLYQQLRDSQTISVEEVRNRWAIVAKLKKAAIIEVARRLGFTVGTRDSGKEIYNRLLSYLVNNTLAQQKAQSILTGY